MIILEVATLDIWIWVWIGMIGPNESRVPDLIRNRRDLRLEEHPSKRMVGENFYEITTYDLAWTDGSRYLGTAAETYAVDLR